MKKPVLLLIMLMPLVGYAQSTPHLVDKVSYLYHTWRYYIDDSTHYEYNTSRSPAYMPQHNKWNSDVSTTKFISGSQPNERERNIFDVDGKQLMSFTDMYDTAWHVAFMSAYTYNAAGLIVSNERFVATGVLGTPLKPNIKKEYSYTPSGQLEVMTTSGWDDILQTREPIEREVYTYNNGKLINMRRDGYGGGQWYWGKNTRYDYTSPTMLEILYQDWNFTTSNWDNIMKEERTLDANGNMVYQIRYEDYLGAWIKVTHTYRTYDIRNNMLWQEIVYEDHSTQQLLPFEQLFYTYNDENNVVSYARKIGYNNAYQNMDSVHYFYDYPTAVTEANTTNEINVYPIPTNNSLHINMTATDGYHAYLYDATGKLAKVVSATGLCTIDVQDLPAGNYVLQVNTNGNITSRKVVIAR